MQNYVGFKRIKANLMTRGEYNKYRGWDMPADEDPNDEGYLVVYPDGYESWSPKGVFEEAYRECDNMTFGMAVEALKKGYKVTRAGWNGKGMYLFLSPSVGCQIYERFTGKDINDIRPFIVMKAADDTLVPWLASQTDVLGEDWVLVD